MAGVSETAAQKVFIHFPVRKGELFVKQKSGGKVKPLGEIVVPFPPKSRLSGVFQRVLKRRLKILQRNNAI